MTDEQPASDHEPHPGEPSAPGPASVPPPGDPAGGPAGAPNNIRVAMLISAILNCIVALSWAAGCVTIFIGIPLVVLAVYEFMTYNKLGQPDWRRYTDRTRTLQILEICSVLLGSLGSMVCGILGLVFANQEKEKGNF